MSFAIIETGGKQYKISEGGLLRTEKLAEEVENGGKVTFDKVLLIADGDNVQIGAPYIEGAVVEASLENAGKEKKIDVIRFRSKSRYHRKYGHRQPYQEFKIGKISAK